MTRKIMTTYQASVTQSRANRVVKTTITHFLAKHDLSMMQWSMIGLVSEADDKGMRISDLARELDTSLAFITTSVNALEKKGYLRRASDATDSRARVVTLTDDFKPKVPDIEADLEAKLREWAYGPIGAKDMAIFLKVLDQIAKNG